MRIVQVANFVTPTSGGLRTCLEHLAHGYAARGHEVVQVLPADTDRVERTPWGRRVLLRSIPLPGTGYLVHPNASRVQTVVDALEPDVLEVHDRTTLRPLGEWARQQRLPSLVVSHERLDRWLQQWVPQLIRTDPFAQRSNASLAASFDAVVCTTGWAAEEFAEAPHLHVVPLGVDLSAFQPPAVREPHDGIRLVMATRLSKEKRADLGIGVVRELVKRGVSVQAVVAGHGPLRKALERRAEGLPVEWLGNLRDRQALAAVFGWGDVVLAPGPVETFGLAALEALACGTPAVVNVHSALPEVVGDAGLAAPSSAFCMADAVQELVARDQGELRDAARLRAERFSWDASVEGFLAVHAELGSDRVLTGATS